MARKTKRYRGTNAEALLRRIQEENLPGAMLVSTKTVRMDERDPESPEMLEVTVQCDDEQARLGSLQKRWRTDDSTADRIERVLRLHKVSPDVRRRLLQQISPAEAYVPPADPDELRAILTRALTGTVPVTRIVPERGASRVVTVLVGPPGGGKTTIAARLATALGAPCGVISSGTTSTRTSATIFDGLLPGAVTARKAEGAKDLRRLLEENRDLDAVVVDTPEICRDERGWIMALGEEETGRPAWIFRYHVVLSLTAKFKNNLALADTYLDHPVSSFVFTRLDESATYGDLLDLPCLRRIPLGALCWGGGAEGELQTATPEILSHLLLPDVAATRPGGNR